MDGVVDTILIDALTPECRIAYMSGSRLVEIRIHREGRGVRAGDVILARVKAVVPSIRGAFLDIGDDRDGFLPFPEKMERPPVHEGEAVIVQVRHEAMAEKGARLTSRISLQGRYVVYTPDQAGINVSGKASDPALAQHFRDAVSSRVQQGDGVVIRTAALALGDDGVEHASEEAARLCDLWSKARGEVAHVSPPHCLIPADDPVMQVLKGLDAAYVRRIVIEGAGAYGVIRSYLEQHGKDLLRGLEHHSGSEGLLESEGVEAQLEDALGPLVPLPSGGCLQIYETPACTTVDVDSGASPGKGRDVVRETNLEAAEALARELRLRNLSGNIAVDFIRDKDREAGKNLLAVLNDKVSGDPVPVEVMGFTRLGLVELVRRRRTRSLVDTMCDGAVPASSPRRSAMTLGYDALRRVLRIASSEPARPIVIRAREDVISVLRGGLRHALSDVSDRAGVPIELTVDDGLSQDTVDVYTS